MKKYQCLIVDDEALARELLVNYIEKIPHLEIVATCATAMEAMAILQQKTVDILFLDIEMPNLNGIKFLQSLPNQPATILTTAYSEYALKGYELGVIDYLLKPIEFERFLKAVMRINTPNQPITIKNLVEEKVPETHFFVKSEGKFIQIAFEDITFIEALQKYIRIHTENKKVLTLLSLSKIYSQLPKHQFMRIHRSFIVNLNKINAIEGNTIKIQNQEIPVSKGQREALFKIVNNRGFF